MMQSNHINNPPMYTENSLFEAIQQQNVDLIRTILSNGVDINARSRTGSTPLIKAAADNQPEIIQLLIDSGANVNESNRSGYSALTRAAGNGYLEIVEILLAHNASPDPQPNRAITTPLMKAAQGGYEEIVEQLLKAGANINAKNKSGSTAISKAIQYGHAAILQQLLKRDALFDPNENSLSQAIKHAQENQFTETLTIIEEHLITNAIKARNITELLSLIESGVDVNRRMRQGSPPLLKAIDQGDIEMVQAILDAGVNINATNRSGVSGLTKACADGKEEIVRLLIEKGANINPPPKSVSSFPLIKAAQGGYLEIVKILIRNGAYVNAETKSGTTPLMRAAQDGKAEIVHLLIQNGAEVNPPGDDTITTALMRAGENGHSQTVQILLENDALIDEVDRNNETTLTKACQRGHTETVELLLQHKPNIEWRDKSQNTPLLHCSALGYTKTASVLIQNGADFNALDKEGNTPLILATRREHLKTVNLLIKSGANLNIRNANEESAKDIAKQKQFNEILKLLNTELAIQKDYQDRGLTELFYSSILGYTYLIALLLKENRDYDRNDVDGMTPLLYACKYGHTEIVSLFLEKGVSANSKNSANQMNALMYACANGHIAIIELLLANGAKLNSFIDADYKTPLIFAIKNNQLAVVRLLISKGCKLNFAFIEGHGYTPLMVAAAKGKSSETIYLLEAGADVNAQTKEKDENNCGQWTALMFAAESGCVEIVKCLLEKGADVNEQNKNGETAIKIAKKQEHQEIIALLEEKEKDYQKKLADGWTTLIYSAFYGQKRNVLRAIHRKPDDINISNRGGYTALSCAAQNGHHEIIQLLLENNAKPNLRDRDGKTALMFACEEGYIQTAKLLVGLTDNINDTSKRGITALMYATRSGHLAIVKLLLDHNANINIRDKYGWTALSLASHNRHQKIANLLISRGGVEGRPKGAYAGFEPDGHNSNDKLDISTNVDSFAKLLAAKELEPPLAIGLFGYWGSGKSFFIQRLKERISFISKKVRTSMTKTGQGQDEYSYYGRIAQIEFNAWHYAEGNLWASLIEHIFNNLRIYDSEEESIVDQRRDRLLTELNTDLQKLKQKSKQLKEQKQQKAQQIEDKEQQIQQKRQAIEKQQQEFDSVDFETQSIKRLWKKRVHSLISEDSLRKIYEISGFQQKLNQLGIKVDSKETDKALQFISEMMHNPEAKESSYLSFFSLENWQYIWQKHKIKIFLFLILFGFSLAIPFLLKLFGKIKGLEDLAKYIATSAALGNGAILAFSKKYFPTIQSIWKKAKEVSPTVMELDKNANDEKIEIQKEFEKEKQVLQQQQDALQKEQQTIQKEKEELEIELNSIQEQIQQAHSNIQKNQHSSLLSNYIQSRAESDDYRKYLGLPAQIRNDLQELSRLMENYNHSLEIGQEVQDDSHLINRIVLYVDDLDRCSTKRVVEIIEAVHLLLAFPLFTVVVAADPRWLTQALQIEYKDLFGGEMGIDSDGDGLPDLLRATPHDYLEKIFQISFWLYPMSVHGRKNLVETLTSNIKITSHRKKKKKI